jgi:hypothetical protein
MEGIRSHEKSCQKPDLLQRLLENSPISCQMPDLLQIQVSDSCQTRDSLQTNHPPSCQMRDLLQRHMKASKKSRPNVAFATSR